jgi:hypothetical protein
MDLNQSMTILGFVTTYHRFFKILSKGSYMKNVVRALVLALAVIGFASEHALTAQAKVTNVTPVVANNAGVPPMPVCPPNDPNGCGISGW